MGANHSFAAYCRTVNKIFALSDTYYHRGALPPEEIENLEKQWENLHQRLASQEESTQRAIGFCLGKLKFKMECVKCG